MIFALSVFVIFGFVGAAIDFSRVDYARRRLQDAADSAVLRAMALKSATDESRGVAADKAFAENFGHPGVYDLNGALKREVNENIISQTYTVHATVSSYFGAFFGKDSYPVTVVSQAKTSLDVFEIAFVLDTTGSMAEANKMPNLKSSVDSAMAGLLQNGKNLSGSKIAVVPFNTQVRLSDATVTTMSSQGLSSGWGNCVHDRDLATSHDVSASAAQKGKAQTLYPLETCDEASLKPVQGLSDNISSARNFIKTLQPGGYTNVTMGVQWGMEVLSPNQPFSDATEFGSTKARKFMIVVTDGDNTKSFTSWSASVIDKRTALACENAKAKGITVYTVKIIQGNSNMLRKCASAPEYFYDLTSANQLNAAMSGIFKSINKTRLSM
ncbi:pilus assembly protein [Asticcacaulis biprosthecium]|nr:pilus assembly protein [Asticcacaulis biprosthecium]